MAWNRKHLLDIESLTAEDITLPPAIRSALDDVSAIEVGYPERWPR